MACKEIAGLIRNAAPAIRFHGSRSSRLRLCFGALAIAGSFATASAFADAAADARDLFARARSLRLHGDCASALPLFRRAYDLYPSGLGSLRNLAECEESLGHFASARRAWLDLRSALTTHRESKYEGWAMDAEQGLARLAPRFATLTVDVEGVTASGERAEVGDVDLRLNGERLQPRLVGVPLERDPGRWDVVIGGRGIVSQERVVDLAAGESKRVVLRVVVPQSSASGQDSSVPPAEKTKPYTAAWVALGAGGASLIAAGIAGIAYQSALDDLNTECPRQPVCSASSQSRVDAIRARGSTASVLVDVFGAAGIAGVGIGIALLATGHSQSAAAALVVSPAGVSVTGSF
jgi:hypothetical protein